MSLRHSRTTPNAKLRRRSRTWPTRALALLLLSLSVPGGVASQEEPPAADEPVCRVFGRVLDAGSGEPVAGALVWLESAVGASFLAGRETSTDGSFAMETSQCGPAVLTVDMIGYVDATEAVAFGDDRMRSVTIRLERSPIELEELTVEVNRSLRLQNVGFYARKAWVEASGKDLGQFLDPEEVEGRAMAYHTVGGIVKNTRLRFIYGLGDFCEGPSYYLDGRWWRSEGAAMRMLEYGIRPEDIEGIEIYRPIHGSVPEEYRDPNSVTCGAVVVWTKETVRTDAPQIAVELCTPSDDPNGITFGGAVVDELTGVHLPASHVTLTVSQYGSEERELEARTDADGRYRYCDLGGWPSSVQARYGSAVAEPYEIDPSRAQPGYFEIDLRLGVIRPGSIVGVVAADGPEVAGAEVTLEGTEHAATLDAEGYFEIHRIMPGEHEVVVRRGDEVLARRTLAVRSGATEAITLVLEQP